MAAAAAVQAPPNPPALDRLHEPLPDTFHVNAGHVSRPQLGFLRPTPADTPISEMRRRLEADNYVFVKGLLPREDVLQMRQHYFSQYADTQLLDPTRPLVNGIYNAAEDPDAHAGIGGGSVENDDLERLTAAHSTEQYVSFLAHPQLRSKVRELMGWESEVLLRRSMLRHNVPGGSSTGVHYDKLFLRGGDAFFLTAWVPIGDIALNGGGLIYLEDSVQLGQAIEDDFSRRADSEGFSAGEKRSAFNKNMTDIGILSNHPAAFEEEHARIAREAGMGGRDYRWLVTNYEAGDVVFHHPCSVHSSSRNEDQEGRIRLSSDLRFYDKKDWDEGRADERWMRVWSIDDGL